MNEKKLIANITVLCNYMVIMSDIMMQLALAIEGSRELADIIRQDATIQDSPEQVFQYKGKADIELLSYFESLSLHISKLYHLCEVGMKYMETCMNEVINTDETIARILRGQGGVS